MSVRTASIAAAAVAGVALMWPHVALAGLVYDASILAPAQGFGTAPRDLTLQATGADTFESGGIGIDAAGAIVFGRVIADGAVSLATA